MIERPHECRVSLEENAALKALLAQTQASLAEHQAALAASEEARRRLESIVGELRREKFGPKSEKLSAGQYNLVLEDVELAQGVLDAAQEMAEVRSAERKCATEAAGWSGRAGAKLYRANAVFGSDATDRRGRGCSRWSSTHGFATPA